MSSHWVVATVIRTTYISHHRQLLLSLAWMRDNDDAWPWDVRGIFQFSGKGKKLTKTAPHTVTDLRVRLHTDLTKNAHISRFPFRLSRKNPRGTEFKKILEPWERQSLWVKVFRLPIYGYTFVIAAVSQCLLGSGTGSTPGDILMRALSKLWSLDVLTIGFRPQGKKSLLSFHSTPKKIVWERGMQQWPGKIPKGKKLSCPKTSLNWQQCNLTNL